MLLSRSADNTVFHAVMSYICCMQWGCRVVSHLTAVGVRCRRVQEPGLNKVQEKAGQLAAACQEISHLLGLCLRHPALRQLLPPCPPSPVLPVAAITSMMSAFLKAWQCAPRFHWPALLLSPPVVSVPASDSAQGSDTAPGQCCHPAQCQLLPFCLPPLVLPVVATCGCIEAWR